MKHAKRMVLVPEDALDRIEQLQKFKTSPVVRNMIHKDTEMTNILKRTDLNDDDKQKMYYANLEKYLNLRQQQDNFIPTVRIAAKDNGETQVRENVPENVPASSSSSSSAVLPDSVIVETIPKSMKQRATLILNRLKTRPDVISWDESGQVSIDDVKIPQSNITDLISDGIRGRRNFNPTGSSQFFHALAKINMPTDLARNEQRWKQVQRGVTSEETASSPGQASPSRYFNMLLKRHDKTSRPKQAEKQHWLKY